MICRQPTRATRRARKGDRGAVLELDHRSFDGFWRLDADGLTNAIEATPSSRFRVAEGADRLLAYAVTGRAGQHGYLQRLAVDPSVRREGYGRAVVFDGLRWLRRHGATQALVNTQCDNAAGAGALPVVRLLRAANRPVRHGPISVRRVALAFAASVLVVLSVGPKVAYGCARTHPRRPPPPRRASRCSSSPPRSPSARTSRCGSP